MGKKSFFKGDSREEGEVWGRRGGEVDPVEALLPGMFGKVEFYMRKNVVNVTECFRKGRLL